MHTLSRVLIPAILREGEGAVRRGLLLARHVIRELARPLGARLAPMILLVLFLVVQFWTLLPWDAIVAALADRFWPSVIGVVLLAANQLTWGPTLRKLLVERPALAPWWRSGLPPMMRTVAIAPVLSAPALPLLLAAVLWPAPSLTLVWRTELAVLFGALAAGGPVGWLALVPVAAFAVVLEGGARAVGLPALLPFIGLGLVALVGPIHARWTTARTLPIPNARLPTLVRPRGQLGALVWRDLAALFRTAPEVPRAAVLGAVPLGVLIWGLRRNGGLGPASLAVAMALAACVVAPLGGVALSRVRVALGTGFFLRRWPPGARMRVASLLLVALALFLPSGAAMAAVSPGVGPAGIGVMGLAAAACAAGAVFLAVGPRFSHGWHLWWVFGVLLLCLWDTAIARVIELAAAATALVLAVWRLERV